MDAVFWDQRYSQQARWTASVRRLFSEKYLASRELRILEVGSGTGVITADIQGLNPQSRVFGLDIQHPTSHFASLQNPAIPFICADGLSLPFADHAFDITLCHFYLLWLSDPPGGLDEMRRVTRPGGLVAALAEPDYCGRIDYPDELGNLGLVQAQALQSQGADPCLGRRLAELMHSTGLSLIQTGLLGGEWKEVPGEGFIDSEWQTLRQDLEGWMPAEELDRLEALDWDAWQRGSRILYVPTFYSWGFVRQGD